MRMLTWYVEHTTGDPSAGHRGEPSVIVDVLDRLLFGRCELKAIVLARTKLTAANAPLMLRLFGQLHGQLRYAVAEKLGRVGQQDSVAIVLLNAAVLMLGSWYRLMTTAAERERFDEDVRPLVSKLQELRIEVRLLTGAAADNVQMFYELMTVTRDPVVAAYTDCQFADMR